MGGHGRGALLDLLSLVTRRRGLLSLSLYSPLYGYSCTWCFTADPVCFLGVITVTLWSGVVQNPTLLTWWGHGLLISDLGQTYVQVCHPVCHMSGNIPGLSARRHVTIHGSHQFTLNEGAVPRTDLPLYALMSDPFLALL